MKRSLFNRRPAAVLTALAALLLPVVAAGPAEAMTRDVHVSYIYEDSLGDVTYDIRFNGTVKSNGPTGYIIDGDFDGYCAPGALTTQYATLAYHGAGDAWGYKTRSCADLPEHFHFTGTRKRGAKIELQVGATSGIANTYGYGTKMSYDIDAH
ncbi:hypothetical protein BX286_0006 [Streptomyces sp. 3211.6]|uniref:hypothetical protein n=1 Tax=Streptomyces sp. 3211.6 TaxID=1938845 RepID=UPI000EB1CF00|nr:hypothetical protein [Streptomyces sp. 3211.6]RKT02144.1 hypothetical protein BX286_0006 [Streptomyces sp. 3211.6]